jgi:hypothetical protein
MPPTYIDPLGDTQPNAVPCVDIRDLAAGDDHVSFDLRSALPRNVDPTKTWIAYGVVVDENGDGVADWRYGIDDLPPIAGDGSAYHRAWRTDLRTGRTDSDPAPRVDHPHRGEGFGQVGDATFSTSYPVGEAGASVGFTWDAVFDSTDGEHLVGAKQLKPFYAWASIIVGGRVVATDYAPDTGWLIPTPDGVHTGGTYATHVTDQLRLTMRIPDGWTFDHIVTPNLDQGIGLEFMTVDKATGWCDASGQPIEAQLGPTVDDVVNYLAGQKMIRISENMDVTVDGYRGKYLEYSTTLPNVGDCHPGEWPLMSHLLEEGESTQTWILDIDGVRLLIDAFSPKASESLKAEFQQIVDSISIGP